MGKDGLTALTGLRTAEVGLVNRGANRKKRFPFFKELEDDMDMEEILKAVLETETDGEGDLEEFLKQAKVSDKGRNAAKGALRILNAFKDEMPKDVMRKLADIAGYEPPGKAVEEKKPEDYKYPEAAKKALLDALPEEVRKQVEPILNQQSAGKRDGEGDALSALPEEAKKQMEAVLKSRDDEVKDLTKKAGEVEKQLKVERDIRELEQWVEKARTELTHFPGRSAEELGKSLKGLSDLSPDLAKDQFEQMKAASDALKTSSLLQEAGASGGMGTAGSGSAWDQVQKMADGIVKKSEDVGMSKEKALSIVLQQRPDLYEQYLKEHPQQVHPSASGS